MKKGIIMTLLAFCLTWMNLFPAAARSDNGRTTALWVWDFYESASNSDKITQLLEFSNQHGINTLFIGTRNTLIDQPRTYDELIRRAHENEIRVFALVGRDYWALESHHNEALEQLRQVLSFQESHPLNKFDGIQYDIEPYTLPEYKLAKDSVVSQYLQVLNTIAQEIEANDPALEFNAAIPWWFGGGDQPVMVVTGEQNKPLSHFVLDIADTISIMAYRDTADKQIRASLADADYAALLGKKVYIGAETNPSNGNTIPNEITYYNKGLDYMNQQLDMVSDYYSEHQGFGGIALHHYLSLQNMMK